MCQNVKAFLFQLCVPTCRYALEHMAGVVAAAAAAPDATAEGILVAAARAAPASALRKFIAVRTAGSSTHGGVCIQTAAVHTFLRELRSTALFAAVAPALPLPRTASSGSLDEVAATNCYTHGSGAEGCCGPAAGPGDEVAGIQHATDSACALQAAQQQQQQQQQQPRSESHDSLASTAAASSSPALAASSAEPAVREDLSRERACMLLLMSPKEVWREISDERLRGEVLALLDTGAHSGRAASAWAGPADYAAARDDACATLEPVLGDEWVRCNCFEVVMRYGLCPLMAPPPAQGGSLLHCLPQPAPAACSGGG